ncbi:ComF family protein [Cellulomonas dongxiuzhuiae]|uniref:ComF family protein n=1 Tax=Cellulomonas dongxiuzhuiae TaxID=2819979 RepID=A0ABX8GH89_9CELL|nr:phosphoribosyltransferase family protein [Cellulomonas dongxiuzhuiae]MBO3086736.1 ComF family protein [Cellulomonas dongxiuzhuiae]MBO3093911.1 ComF family protein [Cellulomonas dongxiuzhuiae]QWC14996.1 ComF family protein [Cellulomonas dongxiuzhuiae]
MPCEPPTAPTPETRSPLRTLLVAACHDLVGLVVPVACAGCGRPDVTWCPPCAATLRGAAVRRDHDAGRLDLLDGRTLLPVWAPAVFVGPVRHAVSAWKDGGRSDLDRPFAAATRRTGAAVAAHLPDATGAGHLPVLVVAVPSTAAARRRRGRAPVDALAAAVTAGLRDGGVPAVRARVLRRSAGPDLAGLTARARGAALAGRVRAHRAARLRGRWVVLVDDVLTTGATLAACHAALAAAGASVLAGVALAATPAPSGRSTAGSSVRSSAPRPGHAEEG